MARRERRRPWVEGLETRELLSTMTVESEPNDRKSSADVAALDPADSAGSLSGAISSRRDEDFFRITVPATGTFGVSVGGSGAFRAKLSVENAAGVKLLETEPNNGRNAGTFSVQAGQVLTIRLRAPGRTGGSYLVVMGLSGSTGGGGTGGGTGGGGNTGGGGTVEPGNLFAEAEPNDDKGSAPSFDLGSDGFAQLSGTSTSSRDRDYFVFTPRVDGTLSVKIGGTGTLASLEVEDPSGASILEVEPNNRVTTGSVAVRAGVRYSIRLRAPRNAPASYLVDLNLR